MTSKMFSFITKTWNPIAGGPCPFNCYKGGCWATKLKKKHDWDKYKGNWRIHESQIVGNSSLEILYSSVI